MESKRAGFLPSRGRRFWSIFDWNDNYYGDKRAGFLPMRGRKAGFLPMRGKKNEIFGDNEPFINENDDGSDANEIELIKKAAFMPMRGKKLMNDANDAYYGQWPPIHDKRAAAFFSSRGKRETNE